MLPNPFGESEDACLHLANQRGCADPSQHLANAMQKRTLRMVPQPGLGLT